MPAVAYIGGPAEVACLAQSAVIYERLRGRMPVAVPRGGCRVFDERSHKPMERYYRRLQDFFHGEEHLRETIAARLVPPSVRHAAGKVSMTVETALNYLRRELLEFDPTLAKAADTSLRRIRRRLSRIEAEVGREALHRDRRAAASL